MMMMLSGGGASYIRWGRTTCEGNATLVYKGYNACHDACNCYLTGQPIRKLTFLLIDIFAINYSNTTLYSHRRGIIYY